jgi:hypothetical protein
MNARLNPSSFTLNRSRRQWRRRDRRGAIFVTALGIIVVLSGLVLVYAQEMRTESVTSANRLAYVQADMVEKGAERYVLALTQTYPGDAISICNSPAEAMQVGGGYFWILHPNPDTDQEYAYGVTDEASKINLNQPNVNMLGFLPGVSDDLAQAMSDWVNPNPTPDVLAYYNFLPQPYDSKEASMETVEEALLIQYMTPQVLYGMDVNHDGVVSAAERAAAANTTGQSQQSAQLSSDINGDSRGIFNFVTVYTNEPNETLDGQPRTNVVGNTVNLNSIRTALGNSLSAGRVTQIMTALGGGSSGGGGAGGGRGGAGGGAARPSFTSLYDFYKKSGMTEDEFKLVVDQFTSRNSTMNTTTGAPPLMRNVINVNTAPRQVFKCLLGFAESESEAESDADALVAKRASADTSSMVWVFSTLSDSLMESANGPLMLRRMTGRSFQYSADIVAVSGDGRAFKRVRIVVDSQAAITGGASKIIYRRDLSSLGWPLPDNIRTALRSGQSVVPVNGTGGAAIMGRTTMTR